MTATSITHYQECISFENTNKDYRNALLNCWSTYGSGDREHKKCYSVNPAGCAC